MNCFFATNLTLWRGVTATFGKFENSCPSVEHLKPPEWLFCITVDDILSKMPPPHTHTHTHTEPQSCYSTWRNGQITCEVMRQTMANWEWGRHGANTKRLTGWITVSSGEESIWGGGDFAARTDVTNRPTLFCCQPNISCGTTLANRTACPECLASAYQFFNMQSGCQHALWLRSLSKYPGPKSEVIE